MTLSWDGLGDDDDEFFEPCNRISCAVPQDSALSGVEEDFDDCRVSFSTAAPFHTVQFQAVPTAETARAGFCSATSPVCTTQPQAFTNTKTARVTFSPDAPTAHTTQSQALSTAETKRATATVKPMAPDYNVWMASPEESITKRRQRLFQGMGLSPDKELLSFKHIPSIKAVNGEIPSPHEVKMAVPSEEQQRNDHVHHKDDTSNSSPPTLPRGSRSEGEIDSFSTENKRREQFIDSISKQRLTKTSSLESTLQAEKSYPNNNESAIKASTQDSEINCAPKQNDGTRSGSFEAFFLIKNLDTGKEFIVNEYDQDGMWNKLSDIQTGKQLTIDEFEKSVGYSPVVKELMSRENVNPTMTNDTGPDRKLNWYLSKSLKESKKRGAAVLKSIKEVATSAMALRSEKEKEANLFPMDQKNAKNANGTNQWVKVRQTGKSYKELSALYICQEIQAHEGSIWTLKFSTDARFLASAGEDTTIHVWEVQECDVTPMNEGCSTHGGNSTPLHSSSLTKKCSSTSKEANQIPSYVHVPETVFSLSDRPICSFKGHLDDVLDLSWSTSQQLLSSSMDKTVRLWDLETKSCLKLFAHNDYVTCIHFNPIDDDYFISGSLDTKVRIWNIPDRQVVDWTDLNELVTAACYTPDGQGAMIGTHKGSCRLYSTEDCRLIQLDQITISNKVNLKKITGFQFSPLNSSRLLVTCADSRIRALDGQEVFYKFKGLKNTNSQISASFTSYGNYVISASEDSQVFVWRCEEPKHTAIGKRAVVTARGHECFPCKDVSVAIAWPGTFKTEPEISHSKRRSKSSTREDKNNKKSLPLPPLPKKNVNNNGRIMTLSDEDSEIGDSPVVSRCSNASGPSDLNASVSSRSASSIRYGDSMSMPRSSSRRSDSLRYGDSPSISPSTGSSWSWINAGGHGKKAAAWGLVIVTASLGGKIRIYQNFGLPRRVSRI
ncbi:WD repeat-containing protein 44-like [Hibiscus syriacus]|uniref:WD repeat-containing protein 44-like n=1 Tax=Hibiscus syriacus TaxID=106335 RepID=UPI001923BB81|nr:WD repeat-containing protein 44-like [Hibiscus syriacus]